MGRTRLRFVAPLRQKTPPGKLDGEIAFLPMEAIGDNGTYDHESVRAAADVVDSGYTYFEQGDVVRARVTPCFENGKGALLSGLASGCGLGTTELFVFRASEAIDARYLFYVTTSHEFTEQGTATLYGAHGVRRVDDQFARDYRVWLPSLNTQRAIADYLDRETVRIDALIAAKRRMIELLEERLVSFFEDSLFGGRRTSGRVANASGFARSMKPFAALERQLAAVPSTWSVVPLRRLVSLVDRHNVSGDAPMLSLTIRGQLVPRDDERQPPADDYVYRYGLVEPGDLVVNPMWITGGAIGVSTCFGAVSPEYRIYSLGLSLEPRFLHFLLRTKAYLQQFRLLLRADTTFDRRIKKEDFRDIPIAFPSRGDQVRIANTLEAANSYAWRLMGLQERAIVLLQDRRQALITAFVTGQLQVSEAA
jgi:type I restriction enzyme S subunit